MFMYVCMYHHVACISYTLMKCMYTHTHTCTYIYAYDTHQRFICMYLYIYIYTHTYVHDNHGSLEPALFAAV